MISRNTLATFIILLAGVLAGYLLARGLNSYLSITFREKDLSLPEATAPMSGQSHASLPFRMVDMGGVGVLPDTAHWGMDYDHNQHVFEDVWLAVPPYIDTAALASEQQKMERYASRMADWGYNAISIPFFLEFINFEKVGNGYQIYGERSEYRSRHDSLVSGIKKLIRITDNHGLAPYLWTDMVALTTPLEEYFRRRFGDV
ncbi:MAG: hypothetical protein ACWGNV_15790, partial [Bacteroidales bacterium]